MRKPDWNYEIGWHPVERICGYRGFWVEVGYNENESCGYVWCVQCCGSGYYFKTKGECYAYCMGRRFLRRGRRHVIYNRAEAEAYCKGRGLHRVLNENRAWEHCVKYGLT